MIFSRIVVGFFEDVQGFSRIVFPSVFGDFFRFSNGYFWVRGGHTYLQYKS